MGNWILAGSRICSCQGGGRRRAGARQGRQREQGQIMPQMESDFSPNGLLGSAEKLSLINNVEMQC